MNIIPTINKNKIAKDTSYPIGAKELSNLLSDSPQYKKFRLLFSDRDTFWSSEYKKRVKEQETIKIIEIEYYRPKGDLSSPKHFIESGHYEPRWTIRIYALPSVEKHKAHELIVGIAVNKFKVWLDAIGDIDEYTFHKMSFGYNLASGTLVEIK